LGASDGKEMLELAPHARKNQKSGEKAARAARGRNVARRRMTRTAIEAEVRSRRAPCGWWGMIRGDKCGRWWRSWKVQMAGVVC
jgi:hypothetical protein